MELFFSWVVIVICLGVVVFYQLRRWQGYSLLAVALFCITYFNTMGVIGALVLWLIWCAALLFMLFSSLRIKYISKPVMKWFASQMPPISKVEQTVLDAGGHWWEKDIFAGTIKWQKLFNEKITDLTKEEQSFLDNQVETLCGLLDDWKICYQDKDLSSEAWKYIKNERFWGIEVDHKYGGLGFSPAAHSAIVTKIATRSVSAAYTVMVPNSLGPAELIANFGTDEQKNKYLPRLASGEEIPCFALTGTHAGSDASNLADTGVVCYETYNGQKTLGVKLNWEKRYITLAPIATLIGLAFHMYDPDNLLGKQQDMGISLALIPVNHPGIDIGKRHSPMTLGFMNGPITGVDVFIPLELVLGDLTEVNQGWSMLIECLSIGRGISMPALSSAVVQQCLKLTPAYARIREQFSRPIGSFEGIEDIIAKISGFSYTVQATRYFTTEAVVKKLQPTVASAISKYHLTELSRNVLQASLDIHAGHGLQMGPSNLLANVFNGQPISTVGEGANIMTRNLIIFGQGILRSHLFLHDEITAAHNEDVKAGSKEFDKLLRAHSSFSLSQLLRGILYGLTSGRVIKTGQKGLLKTYCRKINRMSNALILISDMSLFVFGKDLKIKESISAKLGDIFSQLYLAICVIKYYKDHGSCDKESRLMRWSLDECLAASYDAYCSVIANFPKKYLAKVLHSCLFPWGRPYIHPLDSLSHHIAQDMQQESPLRDRLTAECYVESCSSGPINRVELAFKSVLQTSDLMRKVKVAVKEGVIAQQLTRRITIEEALLNSVINKDEYMELIATEDLRDAALMVDVFAPDDLLRPVSQNHSNNKTQYETK